ncbi:MAG: nucleoside diphosphate kinase [Monoraphidium minutum]|nr:MAG: nucleoside diphosphate kinase [Monoraphidium minutum]
MGDLAGWDAAAAAPYTLAIVKPDAVAAGKAEEILHLAELAGFTVIQQQRLQLTVARAEAFYAEHRERAFFPGLVEFMASGPAVAAVLAKPGAVAAWHALIGPTNPLDARGKAPECLRALYSSDGTRNAVHGSDSPASAAREARFFFPRLHLGGPVALSADAAAAFVAEKLQPTLAKALTALAKAKPSSDKARAPPLPPPRTSEALSFLAHWMLDNNPNKPRLVLPEGAAAAAAEAAAAAQRRAEAAMQAAAADAQAGAGGEGSTKGEAGASSGGAVAHGSAAPDAAAQACAATTVQAAFRGHKARLQVAGMRTAAEAAH